MKHTYSIKPEEALAYVLNRLSIRSDSLELALLEAEGEMLI